MRLIGVVLMGMGASIGWYLGVKGEDLATLRGQLFAFFQVQDPGPVLPPAGGLSLVPAGNAPSLPRLQRGPQ